MGLIKELLLLPVAPVRGTLWVAEKIAEEVERQEFSEEAGVQQLDELERARETGQLSEEEAKQREEDVIAQQISAAKSATEAQKGVQGG